MNFNNPLPVEVPPRHLRSLRDECQELVRLKRMTQQEVDDLLGKPPSYKPSTTSRSNRGPCVSSM